jgi:hypothetical protein
LLTEQRTAHHGEVAVWREGKKGAPAIDEIALIKVEARGNGVTDEVLLRAFETRAAMLGCDTLVHLKLTRGNPRSGSATCGLARTK